MHRSDWTCAGTKVFCFFFSKKKAFLPSYTYKHFDKREAGWIKTELTLPSAAKLAAD